MKEYKCDDAWNEQEFDQMFDLFQEDEAVRDSADDSLDK